jgi:hypothetical protein
MSWDQIFGTLDSRVRRELVDQRAHLQRPIFATGEQDVVVFPGRSGTEVPRTLRYSVPAQRLHARVRNRE